MEATKRMKEGYDCDLLSRLKERSEFGLTGDEMDELLKPEKYIGRCPEQVSAFVGRIRPLFSGAAEEKQDIEL